MIILLTSFGVLLVFGLKLSSKERVIDSFKQQYEIRKRVEEARDTNIVDMHFLENKLLFVTDSIADLDSLVLYRVMVRDKASKIVLFSDFYLTYEK